MLSTLLAESGDTTITLGERLVEPFLYHQTPLIVCAVMGATLGIIGCFVVLRRMALIGDALSHAVLPGVVIAFMVVNVMVGSLEGAAGVWGLFGGALLAGLLTAGFISLVARHSRMKEDAAIGIVFTAMFAIGVILISNLPRGTHFDLKCFLFGDPLAIRSEDLVTALIVSPLVWLSVLVFYRPLKFVSFDPQMAAAVGMPVRFVHYLLMGLLSAAVVAALRSVGVIMSVAMLITPAAFAYQLTNRLCVMLLLSALAGCVSAVLGMFLAFAFDTPPGPAMVVVATLLFAATMALAPEYGLIAKAAHRARVRRHILEEDLLKALAGLGAAATSGRIRELMGRRANTRAVRSGLERLIRRAFVRKEGETFALTDAGQRQANMMIRSHRLWETYLTEHHLPEEEVHARAERLEHAHDLVDDVDRELGHPKTDPHGQPIPRTED